MAITREIITDPHLVLDIPFYKMDGGAHFNSKDMFGHQWDRVGTLWRPKGHYFDGVDDKIIITNDVSLFTPTEAITVEFWVYVDPASTVLDGNVTHVTDAGFGLGAPRSWNMYWDDRGGAFGTDAMIWRVQGTDSTASAQLPDNTFNVAKCYHLVGTYDREYLRFFVDGTIRTTTAFTEAMTASTRVLTIGCNSNSAAFSEFIAGEYRVYTRALRPEEVQRCYQATAWRYR